MKVPKKILKIRNERGVTLTSLAIAIIILSILASIVITYTRINIRAQNYKAMQVDIKNLEDKVAAYYAINDDINELKKGEELHFGWDEIGATDTGAFYVINLTALDNLTLSFGKDFDVIKANDWNVAGKEDYYVINEASHNIFYVKGVQLAGEPVARHTYYTEGDNNNIQPEEITVGDNWWSLPYNGKNGRYRDKNGDVAYIPVGFQVSKDYDTIRTGLIIKDHYNFDEYIWIPIPKIMENGEPIDEEDTDFVQKIERGLKQHVDKPETNYTDQGEGKLYENMLKGIYKYGGFWISKASMDKTTNNLNEPNRLYTTQKRYEILKDLANTFFVENKIKNNEPENAMIDTEPEEYMIYNEDDNDNRLVIYFETLN